MNLSAHFSLEELVESDTARRLGIDNTPPPEYMPHLRMLVVMLERARELLGVPLLISSGYRSPALNERIGGAKKSVHCLCLAADFRAPSFGTPAEVARRLAMHPFMKDVDQLIYEHTWVHMGLAAPNVLPRAQILTLVSLPGNSARYSVGIIERNS